MVATAEVSVSLTVEANAPIDAIRKELNFVRSREPGRRPRPVAPRGRAAEAHARPRRPGLGALFHQREMISMGSNEINLSWWSSGRTRPRRCGFSSGLFEGNGDSK